MKEIISIFIISVFALSGYAQYSGKVFVDKMIMVFMIPEKNF